jgi:hypothetical protein
VAGGEEENVLTEREGLIAAAVSLRLVMSLLTSPNPLHDRLDWWSENLLREADGEPPPSPTHLRLVD